MSIRVPGRLALAVFALTVLVAVPVSAQPVDVTVIAIDGEIPPGASTPIISLNAPFTSPNGTVGFTGGVEDGMPAEGGTDHFVWFDTGIVWRNSDAAPGNLLTGAEGTMGIGDAGQFNYSPSVDGADSVWSDNGLLFAEDSPIPGQAGQFSSFNSRPQMSGSVAYWVGGLTDSVGGSTQARALFRSADTATPTIEIVFQSGDMVGGFPIDFPSGVGFDYSFSDDGTNHLHDLLLDTGSTTDDGAVYLNGAIVAREASPSGGGDNWDNFDAMSINNAGNYLFSGDTDGSTTTDEFIAYNGAIQLRQGDTVDGFTLGASVSAVSINDLGQAVFIWNTPETLFFAPDASDLASAITLLADGDEVDVDGDGTADFTVTDFNASNVIGPGLDLAEDGSVYVEVDLEPILTPVDGLELEAIVRLGLPVPDISATPDPYDFGQVEVGMSAAQTFTIENEGGADLTINGYGVGTPSEGGTAYTITDGPTLPLTLLPGETTTIEVTFAPLDAGVVLADLTVNSDDPDTPQLLVPLSGEGIGGTSILEIPTLGPAGLGALALLLAAAAFGLMRRKRTA